MARRALSVGRCIPLRSGPRLNFIRAISRVPIDPDTIQRFTLNPPEEQQVSKPKPVITANKEAVPMSRRQIVYNMISTYGISLTCQLQILN